jgi:hypothetical protein
MHFSHSITLFEKAVKERQDKKATRNDAVPGDVLKLWGDDNLKAMTQLINSMHETGQKPAVLTEVTIAL